MNSPDFEQAFRDLMDMEGWGQAHEVEGDPGGLTVYGISRNAWPEMYEDGLPTEEEAREFYREVYWQPLSLDELRSHQMAFEIFEFSVNSGDASGYEVAVEVAQKAANAVLGLDEKQHWTLNQDGLMGPRTRTTLDYLASRGWKYRKGWVRYFNKYQLEYYESLPRDLRRRFLLGWAIQRT